jgi:hypothetical protein
MLASFMQFLILKKFHFNFDRFFANTNYFVLKDFQKWLLLTFYTLEKAH